MRNMPVHTFEEIVAAIVANNGEVIDDHSRTGHSSKPYGIGELVHEDGRKNNVYLCNEGTIFCLNPVYIDQEDQTPHLSQWSCGGNYYPKDMPLIKDLADTEIGYKAKIARVHIFQ